MPRKASRLPAETIKNFRLTLNSYKAGAVTLLEENRTPPPAAVTATNLMQIQDGIWAHKWGSEYYSVAAPANVDGAFSVVNPDMTEEILEVAGGVIYRSTDGGAKTTVTLSNGTLTAGKACFFKQIRGYVYITNGVNPLIRYNTTTKTATGYTALTTPFGLALTKTGLVGTTFNAYYVIVATNDVGTTVGSVEQVITVGRARDNWPSSTTAINTTDTVTLTWNRVTNAKRYSIFYADQSGYETFLDSITDPGAGTTATYIDDGRLAPNSFVELPNDNTTTGPLFTQMELSGNRIWATGDASNPWRVYWAGVGQFTGAFSSYYGGGYVDLELGGRERPTAVKHYRDGRGSTGAIVLTTDPEGNGSTWQILLETVTVGQTSFIVPSAIKLTGSIGAGSSLAVASVGDDIVFGNAKGAYSLGSQVNVLNVLSTREISANIRPSWRNLTGSGIKNMANYYFDAKLFWAVPNNSVTNTEIWVRDAEKQNWQLAWTGVAVKSFFEYTNATGRTSLMGVPVAGTRLIRFGDDIKGDLGIGFATKYKSGILPVNPDHNKFAQVDNIFIELGRPLGKIILSVYGYEYKSGFVFLGGMTINGGARSSIPWGYQWTLRQWSYVGTVPTLVSPSVVRRSMRLNKLVNNLQFVVTTETISDYLMLLELEATGFIVDVDPPRQWKSDANPVSIDRQLAGVLLDSNGNPILDSNGNPILA